MKVLNGRYMRTGLLLTSIFAFFTVFFLWLLIFPSSNYPNEKPFLVEEGENIKRISSNLRNDGYIRSSLLFRALISILNQDTRIQTGFYSFPKKSSLLGVALTFVRDGPSKPLFAITIPEGSTEEEIARIIHKELPNITEKEVLTAIHDTNSYGFLFPETYYLTSQETALALIKRMTDTFAMKYNEAFTTKIKPNTMLFDTKLRNDISLAAILEREANLEKDMKIISGILQKRLHVGMALQVDVAKETYRTRGVPPVPIANPGLVSLRAVREPTPNSYFYYITGKDGKMYYAVTFEEHKANIKKYLK